MGSIESGPLETAAIFFPLPSPLPQAGEGGSGSAHNFRRAHLVIASEARQFRDLTGVQRRHYRPASSTMRPATARAASASKACTSPENGKHLCT